MKVIFANGRRTYPLFNGGDGILIHDYLLELSKDGNQVIATGKINNPDFNEKSKVVVNKLKNLGINLYKNTHDEISYYHNKKYKCILYSEKLFLDKLEKDLRKFKPDIILTQLNYSHKVIEIAHRLKLKTVLFIHDNHSYNFLPININNHIDHVIFNSKNTANHFKNYLSCKHSIIYPCIKFENYISTKNNKKYITMINPTDNKGGKILFEIIKNFPKEQFLIVKGWQNIDPKFNNFSNVKILNRQYDMKKIYSETKILLVPSQWEEAFARVVPEAMSNRIPVVASKVGGLIESVGSAGILINDFVNPKEWISELNNLLNDKSLYKKISSKSYKQSQKFKFENGYLKLKKVLNSVHNS